MRVDEVLADFDGFMSSADHVEFYWVPHTGWALTKRNRRTDEPAAPRGRVRELKDDLILPNLAFGALFVLYATRTLDISPGVLGLVLGAGAVGGLVGAALATPLTRRIGVGPTVVAGFVLFPAPLLLVPLAAGSDAVVLACLFLAEFGSGLGVMLLDIGSGSIFAAVIPPRLRSRVSGAYTFVNYGVRVFGSLVGGLLGSTIGLRPTLWIGAAGALLGVLWLLPSPVPRLRVLPEVEE